MKSASFQCESEIAKFSFIYVSVINSNKGSRIEIVHSKLFFKSSFNYLATKSDRFKSRTTRFTKLSFSAFFRALNFD